MEDFQSEDNSIDVVLRTFVAKYRYELLAGFSFLALLGGIVASVIVFRDNSRQEITLETSQTTEETIMVDVSGAVKTPGIYEFSTGSRIIDAIEKSGGFSETADTRWVDEMLNQAESLVDGQKIFIPVTKPTTVPDQQSSGTTDTAQTPQQDSKININTATVSDLVELPGIGETYAQRIIEHRPYKAIAELLNVPGIGPKKFESIKDLVSVY